jgi:hypothetical protein
MVTQDFTTQTKELKIVFLLLGLLGLIQAA